MQFSNFPWYENLKNWPTQMEDFFKADFWLAEKNGLLVPLEAVQAL